MEEIKPINEYLLVRLEDEKKEGGLYFGENKDKPKIAEILAFSDKCENKFVVGKKVMINRYEMIPNGDSTTDFFVNEKAIIAMM